MRGAAPSARMKQVENDFGSVYKQPEVAPYKSRDGAKD